MTCTVRLSVRTQAFHACKTGSIPVPCTKNQVLATVLNWRASRPIWLGQAGPATSRLLEKIGAKVFMDAHQPVTLEEGDRYPLVPPVMPL